LRGFGYLRHLGPGLITGAADDDPSGIATYSQVGAAFGFGLLWTTLVSLPLATAVQETAARLGLVSGKGLATLIKERFPRGVVYLAVMLVTAANVFNIGADLGSMAAAARLLVPVPHAPLVLAMTAVILGLEIWLSYHQYARILRWLTVSLMSYLGVLLIQKVEWSRVLTGLLVPRIHGSRDELLALIAVFGTTISPYLFFWQASEEVEERIERHESGPVTGRHLRAMRIDVMAGMASGVGAMFAIMVASAATLGAHGVTDIQTADQAALALRPLAGPLAELLFAVGILGTGLLAVPVLAGSTAYALAEAFGWREGLSRKPAEAKGFYAALAVAMLLGVTLGFAGIPPIKALYYSAVLNGVAAPPILLLMLLLSRSLGRAGGDAGARLSDWLVGTCVLVMGALPIAYLLG
jgi:NRAMP (natural resistance-associated macrophage protein)-like metal ion transporter